MSDWYPKHYKQWLHENPWHLPPKEYWDVYSEEQRVMWIMKQLTAMKRWLDYLVEQMQEYIDHIDEEIEAMKAEIAAFEEEMRQEMADFEAKIEAEIEEFEAKVEEEIAAFEAEMRQEMADFEAKIEAEIEEFEAKVEEEIAAFEEEMRQEMADFEAKIEAEIEAFEAKVEEEIAAFEAEMRQEMADFEAKIEAEIDALEEEWDTFKEETQATIDDLIEQWNKFKTSIDDEVSDLQTEIEAFETTVNEQVEQMQAELQDFESSVNKSLEDGLAEIKAACDACKTEIYEYIDSKIEGVTDRVVTLEDEVSSVTENIEMLTERIDAITPYTKLYLHGTWNDENTLTINEVISIDTDTEAQIESHGMFEKITSTDCTAVYYDENGITHTCNIIIAGGNGITSSYPNGTILDVIISPTNHIITITNDITGCVSNGNDNTAPLSLCNGFNNAITATNVTGLYPTAIIDTTSYNCSIDVTEDYVIGVANGYHGCTNGIYTCDTVSISNTAGNNIAVGSAYCHTLYPPYISGIYSSFTSTIAAGDTLALDERGLCSTIIGSENCVMGVENSANAVIPKNSIIAGCYDCDIHGLGGDSCGIYSSKGSNIICRSSKDSTCVIIGGYYCTAEPDASTTGALITGEWNNTTKGALFVVGNGKEGATSDAFVVTSDGVSTSKLAANDVILVQDYDPLLIDTDGVKSLNTGVSLLDKINELTTCVNTIAESVNTIAAAVSADINTIKPVALI